MSTLTIFSSMHMEHVRTAASNEHGSPTIRPQDQKNDGLDNFNHPRLRQALILSSLHAKTGRTATTTTTTTTTTSSMMMMIQFETTPAQSPPVSNLSFYQSVHTDGLLNLHRHGWTRWLALGTHGQDPSGHHLMKKKKKKNSNNNNNSNYNNNNNNENDGVDTNDNDNDDNDNDVDDEAIPFIPPCVPLPRVVTSFPQRPSQHVLGQMGYYCTDTCTPIFADLYDELLQDAATVQAAVEHVQTTAVAVAAKHPSAPDDETTTTAAAAAAADAPEVVVYALPIHPGHHAATDSFGGYCYVNHVAAMARALQQPPPPSLSPIPSWPVWKLATGGIPKIAILDVDYHCGNGTASIFYDDPTVLVVSIHCHPDYDYPFHTGMAEDIGTGAGQGTTLHLPLLPGTTWTDYQVALQTALQKIADFDPTALIVSLGLDTYDQDPCALRRAGFGLQGDDYVEMGRLIAAQTAPGVPILFVQEGGYRMDVIGEAAANVVLSCRVERTKSKRRYH